jgi:predicted transcriptional regulator
MLRKVQETGGDLLSPLQARLARAALKLTFGGVAKLCDVSPTTVQRVEGGDSTVQARTIKRMRRAFEDEGIMFIGADTIRYTGQHDTQPR